MWLIRDWCPKARFLFPHAHTVCVNPKTTWSTSSGGLLRPTMQTRGRLTRKESSWLISLTDRKSVCYNLLAEHGQMFCGCMVSMVSINARNQ
jgi:hypothetical protein